MAVPYNQATNAPSRKVIAAGGAPIFVAIVLGVFAMFYPDLYKNLPAGFELQLGLGLGGLLSWAAGYYRRNAT